MRILPIFLLVLVAGTAQSQERSPNAPPATTSAQDAAAEQLKAKIAELQAQLDAVNSGRATPTFPAFPNLPRIGQLRIPAAAAAPANATQSPAGNCAIPLVTAKPAPGVNFTMRQYTADVDSMAPMPQIKVQVCDSPAR